jgi:hypothetical protein
MTKLVGGKRSGAAVCFVGKWARLAGLLLLVISFLPCSARAHPDLDRAIAASAELEFTAALRHFQRALESKTLTREELANLYAERALLLHALRRTPEVVADFRWLAAIDPQYQLDRRAPPDLTSVWDSVRSEAGGAATVELRDESTPSVLRVRPVVTGARPEQLQLEAFARAEGGEYTAMDELSGFERQAPAGHVVEAYAQLTGPFHVVIASAGSPQSPLRFAVPGTDGLASSHRDGDPGARRRRRIWISSAAAAVAVAALVGALVAMRDDDPQDVRLQPVPNF